MNNYPEPSLTPAEERDIYAEDQSREDEGDRECHRLRDELDDEPPEMDGFASMIFDTACLLNRQYRRFYP